MPKATNTPTPSRRVFIGSTAIGLLAAGPVAALAALPGANPDAEFINACAEYHRIHAMWDSADVTEKQADELGDVREELLERLRGWAPQTPEGLRAKAGVGFGGLLWQVDVSTETSWREQANATETIAIETLRDLSGLPEPVKALRLSDPDEHLDVPKWKRDEAALMAACTAFHAAADAERAACGGEHDLPPELTGAVYDRLDDVMALSADTLPGLWAKARVLQVMIRDRVFLPGEEEIEHPDPVDAAVYDFLNELAERSEYDRPAEGVSHDR